MKNIQCALILLFGFSTLSLIGQNTSRTNENIATFPNGEKLSTLDVPCISIDTIAIDLADYKAESRTKILPTAINNSRVDQKIELNVFPYPATDYIIVTSKNNSASQEIRIYNKVGQQVFNQNNFIQNEIIQTSEFDNGTYVIELIDNENNTKKLKNFIVAN